MKYSVVTKSIAIVLAACALSALAFGIVGVVLVSSQNLYSLNPSEWAQQRLEAKADRLAERLATRYAAQNLSNCDKAVLERLDTFYCVSYETLSNWYSVEKGSWGYRIENSGGALLDSVKMTSTDTAFQYTLWVTPYYPVDVGVVSDARQYPAYYLDENGQSHGINYSNAPQYTITLSIADRNAYNGSRMATLIEALHYFRYTFIACLIAGVLVFIACMVYLCCAAGRSPKSEQVAPGGLNRLPLDLYAAVTGLVCIGLSSLIIDATYYSYYDEDAILPGLILFAALFLTVAVVVVGFIFAVAAQCKVRNFYWWHHSIIGWVCGKIWKVIRFIGKGLYRLFSLLPLIWQWLLIGAALGFSLFLSTLIAADGTFFFLLLDILVCIAAVCYGAYAFGTLLQGAKQMAEGELNTKISTRRLTGAYARCAEHLNALADAATLAAKKQLRSDRMKTELITNVSHDIKTPLTSIINYVDLLQKTEDPHEREQYLEVLSRQSQQMKRLIEDLMDMSKATTGNMPVEITQVDAAEAVTQALGEFSDKLALAKLTPVFRRSEQSVAMLADGRLTWRVLSNLLNNAVKYALPGTRLYVDLMRLDSHVVISLKNISREELNISADELTERFVRGDASRNTEGSGLGLNIAKSLMELQRGSLELLVDGDLFKVTLCFPAA